MLEAGETPFATVLGAAVGTLLSEQIYRGHGIDLRTEALAAGFRADHSGRVCGIELADRLRRPVRRRPRRCRHRAGPARLASRRLRSPVRRRRSGRARALDERRGRRCSCS